MGARKYGLSTSTARPRGLPGECGTLEGFPTGDILAILGPGAALPSAVRVEMDAAFGADFGRVRVHTGLGAQRIAAELGAEAFAIGNHVAFRRGRFQPHSFLGRELLRHELAHTLEAAGREDRIDGWFTTRLNSGTHTYTLGGQCRHVVVGAGGNVKTHEVITREALDYIGGYGAGARRIIDFWVAEIDRWKTGSNSLSVLASRRSPGSAHPDFPELSAIIRDAGGMAQAVNLLHAYGGQDPAAIGMTISEVEQARRTGSGVIGNLLNQAVAHFTNGRHDHALRLLGISLHTIQDFYSHHVPLRGGVDTVRVCGVFDLRTIGSPVHILEDDSRLDERRWLNARHRTAEQLREFVTRLQPAKIATLRTM